ncbi:MAG: T9SS type A sorting domain-containing protein [Sphingobacteriales bacterium]|nr:MAG: T9SS type A sorting domain-containing protein [Sphingobacteriales bacterium]
MKQTTIAQTTLQLTPTETSLVQTIAQSNTKAAFEAQCIRYLTHGEEYQIQLPPLPQEVLNGYWQMYINFKNVSTFASNSLQIHPNPASDILTLNYVNTDDVAATLEWYNTVGKVQDIQTLPNSGTYSIDVSQWANGIYFCRMITNGNNITIYKVMIMH